MLVKGIMLGPFFELKDSFFKLDLVQYKGLALAIKMFLVGKTKNKTKQNEKQNQTKRKAKQDKPKAT